MHKAMFKSLIFVSDMISLTTFVEKSFFKEEPKVQDIKCLEMWQLEEFQTV
jgi:hypothetical protein